MRIVRIQSEGDPRPRFALDEGDAFRLLDESPFEVPLARLSGTTRIDRDRARLLAPVVPGKIVCVGRNYAAHAKELGNQVPEKPTLFLKPPSSVIGPGAAIVRPVHMSELVHHEGEIAVVMGARLRRGSEDEALSAVLGYTCANDVTARDIQREEKIFTRAKGFDTFCPLGPCVVTADEVADPQALEVKLTVDGEIRQHGFARDMAFPIRFLLSFISQVMTLEPGDVVLTGTPEGVGPLLAGQTVRVEVPGIGALENPVVDPDA